MAKHLPADVPPGLATDPPRDIIGLARRLKETGYQLARLWNEVKKLSTGDPWEHGATHRVTGTDPLPRPINVPVTVTVGGTADRGVGPSYMREDAQLVVATGTPSGLANANTAGTSSSAPHLDHQHKRDVRVYADGTEVATRNALDFLGSSVVDNAGADRVTVEPSLIRPFFLGMF